MFGTFSSISIIVFCLFVRFLTTSLPFSAVNNVPTSLGVFLVTSVRFVYPASSCFFSPYLSLSISAFIKNALPNCSSNAFFASDIFSLNPFFSRRSAASSSFDFSALDPNLSISSNIAVCVVLYSLVLSLVPDRYLVRILSALDLISVISFLSGLTIWDSVNPTLLELLSGFKNNVSFSSLVSGSKASSSTITPSYSCAA